MKGAGEMQKRKPKLPLQKLSVVEILFGLFAYLPRKMFREENLYAFLENTGDPRFRTRAIDNFSYSEMVHRSLAFFAMVGIIYEADSIQYIAPGMKKHMERELRQRNVLPRHAKTLRALARSFADTQNNAG